MTSNWEVRFVNWWPYPTKWAVSRYFICDGDPCYETYPIRYTSEEAAKAVTEYLNKAENNGN